MIEENILKEFKDKNVLVTGGTGLIGRQVVDILCNAEANVNIVSLDKINMGNIANHTYGDLTEFGFCKEITKNMDYVFHLAGIKNSIKVTENKPASFFVPLIQMNTNVLEACRLNDVVRVVYTSSIGAYEASNEIFRESNYKLDSLPMDLYPGWAKRAAELQIQAYKKQYGLKYSIVRPCNVFGPGDSFDPKNAMVIPTLLSKILKYQNSEDNKPIEIWGDGSAIRDFLYSRDAAEGITQALYHGTDNAPSGFVNLGSGIGYSIKELVETLHSFLDFEYRFDITKPSGYPKRVMDTSLAKKLIHFNPTTSLLDGLKETWGWYINNQNEYMRKKNYFI